MIIDDGIKSYYLKEFRSEAMKLEKDFGQSIVSYADKILDFILTYPDINGLTEIDFSMIKRIVGSDDNNKLTYTLHLMALEPYDVLKWVFYVEDDDEGYDRHYFEALEIAQIVSDKTYYNPLTGEDVSKEEFANLVNTVYGVSEHFKAKVNLNRGLGLHS